MSIGPPSPAHNFKELMAIILTAYFFQLAAAQCAHRSYALFQLKYLLKQPMELRQYIFVDTCKHPVSNQGRV